MGALGLGQVLPSSPLNILCCPLALIMKPCPDSFNTASVDTGGVPSPTFLQGR